MTDYTPVDCGLHSEFELRVMRRQPLRLTWRDAQGMEHTGVYRPLDLCTRDGGEFMLVTAADDRELQLRLDHILACHPD